MKPKLMVSVLILVVAIAAVTGLAYQTTANAQSNGIYDGPFGLQGACYYNTLANIDNAAGKAVVGSISVTWGVGDFFIMTPAQLTIFRNGAVRNCGGIQPVAELSAFKITRDSSYSVNFVVPDDETYDFVVYSPVAGVSGYITLGWANAYTPQTAAYTPYTYSPTSNSVTTFAYFPTTATSARSLQMPQPPQPTTIQSTNNTPQLVLVLVFVAAVALASLFLYSRRKGQPKITKAEKTDIDATRLPTKTAEGKRFCIECGNELPSILNFCDSCGTKQP